MLTDLHRPICIGQWHQWREEWKQQIPYANEINYVVYLSTK